MAFGRAEACVWGLDDGDTMTGNVTQLQSSWRSSQKTFYYSVKLDTGN